MLPDLEPGVRFSPSDREVIGILVKKSGLFADKVHFDIGSDCVIQEIDFYSFNPDQLSLNNYGDEERNETYFFAKLHKKDADSKPDRSTSDGYWDEIGGDVAITNKKTQTVGYRKTFVFRFLSADDGKDNFYMDEFRLNPRIRSDDLGVKNNIKNMVICKVERMSPNCFLIPKVEWVKGANCK